jgi:hypothetical protein
MTDIEKLILEWYKDGYRNDTDFACKTGLLILCDIARQLDRIATAILDIRIPRRSEDE